MDNRIRELRKDRGLSLKELALRVGANTSFGTIAKLERGDMKLSFDWMVKIAAALHVEPVELIADVSDDDIFIKLMVFDGTEMPEASDIDAQFDDAVRPNSHCYVVPLALLEGLASLLGPLMASCVLDTTEQPVVAGGLYLLRDRAGAYHGRIYRENPDRFEPERGSKTLKTFLAGVGQPFIVGRIIQNASPLLAS